MQHTKLKKQVAAMLKKHVLPEYVKAAEITRYYDLPFRFDKGICYFIATCLGENDCKLFELYLDSIGINYRAYLFPCPLILNFQRQNFRTGITDRIAWMQKLIAEVEGEG